MELLLVGHPDKRPTRSEQCINQASRPLQGTVNGGSSLNDLAVHGTLNTTNQPTLFEMIQRLYYEYDNSIDEVFSIEILKYL